MARLSGRQLCQYHEVTRFNEETVLPVQPQYGETFWKTAVPISCEDLFTYEPFLASALYSSSPVGMVSRHKRVSSLTHENLPHPSQLMSRMRRYHRLQKHTPSVLQHIGELRMKQRHINELKGDKWWGATAVPRPEDSSGSPEGGDEQLLDPAAGVSFSAMLMDNPDVTMTMPYEAAPSPNLLCSFTEYEQFHDLAPGGNPMMAFVSGTAHRSLLMADNVYDHDTTVLSWAVGQSRGEGLQVSADTVTVETEGTYFIYSQVLYKDTTWVMGHVIMKRHKGAETKLMKCLKSMPSNVSQPLNTCYTAGIYFLESGSTLQLYVPRKSAELILTAHATFMGLFNI
ncbi:uncharacterized protein [Sinocyclocheilus grahami]|uniref:uncharacterized protein n=1 Tax=Sinocyclocheilus grahami TaxID=75366 RepID=UPI0007AD0E6A|nr:PREDICTED: uncharacterized protein LOC107560319 [Sinocyclocheilus grahami]